jgi:hypothetical protein
MAANLMLKDPLSIKEFRMIAAGEKEDAELARKTVNMAVASLREVLGVHAIHTTADVPALNLDVLRIDVLEASDLLDDAARALRRGSLIRAIPAILDAMSLSLGKVPFPSLYENLFEALRDDFDARLRKVTIEAGRRLIKEEDYGTAVLLLKRYFDTIPSDPEIADLLKVALEFAGNKAEVSRINLKLSVEKEAE